MFLVKHICHFQQFWCTVLFFVGDSQSELSLKVDSTLASWLHDIYGLVSLYPLGNLNASGWISINPFIWYFTSFKHLLIKYVDYLKTNWMIIGLRDEQSGVSLTWIDGEMCWMCINMLYWGINCGSEWYIIVWSSLLSLISGLLHFLSA